RNQTGQTIRFW
ncbi:Molybdopterin molybdenumtransferase, partial [Haemophilus influenzae]